MITEQTKIAVHADLYRLLDAYPEAAETLLEAVLGGKIHGGNYEPDSIEQREGGCLYCWAAKACGMSSGRLINDRFSREGAFTPAERLILCVLPGATPATSTELALVESCIREWLADCKRSK